MGLRICFKFFFSLRNQIVQSGTVDSLKEQHIQEREFAKMRKFTLEMRACEEKKDESQMLRSVLVAQK